MPAEIIAKPRLTGLILMVTRGKDWMYVSYAAIFISKKQTKRLELRLSRAINAKQLVSWSLMSLFSTNMAISETKWR